MGTSKQAPTQEPRHAPPMEDAPLYNSRIIDTYVRLIKKRYKNVNVREILNSAGMELYQVNDPGHWFSQRQIDRFHARLSQVTRNPNISREAGRYGAAPDATGLVRPYILGMVDPARAYSMVGRAAGKFTRASTFEPNKLGPNKVEIKVSPIAGVQEKLFQCQNRIGFLESITAGFLSKLPKIEHPECIHRGGRHCRYLITWERSLPIFWRRLSPVVFSLIIAWIFIATLFFPHAATLGTMAVILILFLVVSIVCAQMENQELKTGLSHLLDSTENLLEQINQNYNNSIITNEIGIAISGKASVAEVLANIIQTLQNRLDYDRGMILLTDAAHSRLEFRAGFGYSREHQKRIKDLYFHLDNPQSRGVFVVCCREQKAILVDDIDDIEGDLSERSLEFVRMVGSKSFICCPIIGDGDSLGILAVDNLDSKRPLVETDLRLLKGIAAVLGISIKNANLIEARERQTKSILHVLGASIDARDPLTKGHSEMVTEYAMGICETLGIDPAYKEAVRVAAFLHDYGKIGVPDAVLKKPGKLTMEEMGIIRTHASKTKDILEQIHFEGVFTEVPAIAGYHHEKYDGSGYPDGLRGEAIPLGARIIAVADFFEAITSMRHYRAPMGETEAMLLLRKKAGSFFDPQVVEAFTIYYLQNTDLRTAQRLTA